MTDEDPESDPLLRSMRSVWLGMRDEEPPARGLAELMAAARTQAETMKPKESWWRKSLALLVRPPVLAAATVIVVVGGAIALNRKGVETAVPTASVESRAAEPAAKWNGAAKDEAAPQIAPGIAAGSAAPTEDRSVRNEKTAAVSKPPPAKKLDTNAVKEVPPPPPPPPPPPEQPQGGGEGLFIAGDSPKPKVEPKSEQKPQEPVRERPEPAKLDDVESDAPTAGRAPTRTASPTDQLVKQAELAASRNDCPAVRATAERVKKSDPSAYKSRLTTKPAIARCLK